MADDNGWPEYSGVYCILNEYNNKTYVGSTNNLKRRRNQHLFKLKSNTHPNEHLQSSYNKYGSESFKFIVLEKVNNNKELLLKEQYWIIILKSSSREFGYNICPSADRTSHSDETRQKMSKVFKERYNDDEYKKKMSEAAKRGWEEHRDNYPSRKGCKLSKNARENVVRGLTGRVCSEETKKKISESLKGKPLSEERKKKISNTMKALWKEYGGEYFGR